MVLLLGLDQLLPSVDSGEVALEVGLHGEGVGTLRTAVTNLLVNRFFMTGELALLPEAESTVPTLEGLLPLVDGGHVPGQIALLGEGETTAGVRTAEADVSVDGGW